MLVGNINFEVDRTCDTGGSRPCEDKLTECLFVVEGTSIKSPLQLNVAAEVIKQ
jgi:hypothetical protein